MNDPSNDLNHDPFSEIRGLAEAQLRGELDDDAALRLEQLIRENPETLREYVIYLQDSYEIHEWTGCCDSNILSVDDFPSIQPPTLATPESHLSESPPARKPSTQSLAQAIHPDRHRAAFLAAASLLTVIFCGALLLMIGAPDHHDPQARSEFIATVTHTDQAVWAQGQTGVQLGARLLPGDRLELEKGLVHLLFRGGARVVLEGPAAWRVDTPGAMTLEEGKILARVSRQARGFTVETPTVDLVDLGTEFGVYVEEGETRLQVFEGRIQAFRHGDAGDRGLALSAGRAIVFGISPSQGFYAKEKKMNRAIYLSLVTVMAVSAPARVDAVPILPVTSGLAAHFDAQALALTNGAAVPSWTDETGNGHHAVQATVIRQPTYVTSAINGNAAVRFVTTATSADGGDDNLVTNSFMTNPYSIFAVVQMAGTQNFRSISNGPGGSNWLLGHKGGAQNRMFAGGFLPSTSQTVDTLTHLWTGTGSGTLTSLYQDGALQGTSGTFLASPNFLSFSGNGSIQASDVDIAEVLIYNRILTDSERSLVGAYIRDRYALTIAGATPIPVPEPATAALLGLGGMMVMGLARRRRRSRGKVS